MLILFQIRFNNLVSTVNEVHNTKIHYFFSQEEPCLDLNLQNGLEYRGMDELEDQNIIQDYNLPGPSHQPNQVHQISHSQQSAPAAKKKTKKFRDEESRRKWEDMMAIKRRKLFTNIIKKEIGKQHRSKINRHKEMLLQCKRIASHCAKHARQKAVSEQNYFSKMFH